MAKRTRKSSAQAKNKAPKALQKEAREALERDIMHHFAMQAGEQESPVLPSASEIAVIAAALCGGSRTGLDAAPFKAAIDEAIELWKGCAEELAVRARTALRREALQKLLFPDGKVKIPVDTFLQRLLPDDEAAKRSDLLDEALRRIPTTFVRFFEKGGPGWPRKHLAKILEDDPGTAGEGIMNYFQNQIVDGVTLDSACLIAPYVLAWRKFVSSSRMRGSMRQIQPKPEVAAAEVLGNPAKAPENPADDAK